MNAGTAADGTTLLQGDWDGDGFCDILAVERHTGRVEMWRNLYRPGDKSPTFANPVWAVDSGSSQHLCTEGWGWGLYDQGLRFADLGMLSPRTRSVSGH